ncbi:hypothetical protein SLE2022_035410 [Rubroshorea leprosula]
METLRGERSYRRKDYAMAGPDQSARHSSEALHQRKKLVQFPANMAVGLAAWPLLPPLVTWYRTPRRSLRPLLSTSQKSPPAPPSRGHPSPSLVHSPTSSSP